MKKKVLVGFIMDGKSGGIDRYLLTMLEALKEEEIEVDFLTNEVDIVLKQRLQSLRTNLYGIPNLKHPREQYKAVRRLLQKKQYDAVYLNVSTAIDCIAAFAAKKEGIKQIILHSHSSGNDCESDLKRRTFDVIHRLCKFFFYKAGTKFYGCSEKAGAWMFPKNIVSSDQFGVIYNAIQSEDYLYSEEKREVVREEQGIKEEYVIGHVGNFCYQKNHKFLLEVFKHIYIKDKSARLWLIGSGRLLEEMKQLTKSLEIESAVCFFGSRQDVNCLMQGMDVFLLPSHFEGLPTVGIEAQYAGLPCVMSDSITKEAAITKQCEFLSLESAPKVWADYVLEMRTGTRQGAVLEQNAKGYQLEEQKKQYLTIFAQ